MNRADREKWADRLTGLASVSPLALHPGWVYDASRAVRDHATARRWQAAGSAYGWLVVGAIITLVRTDHADLAGLAALAQPVSPLYWWPLATLVARLRRVAE